MAFVWTKQSPIGARRADSRLSAQMARKARWLLAVAGLFAGAAFAQSTDILVNHNGLYGGVDAAFGPAGGTFTYQARVQHNAGPTAAGVLLTENLPVGGIFENYSSPAGITCSPALTSGTVITNGNNTLTCAVGTLGAADGVKVVNFNVVLPDVGTNWQATASTTHAGTDNDTGNNTNLPRNFTTNAAADLGVELIAPATVANGAAFNYTINVTSYGPSAIPAPGRAEVTFQIPNGAVIAGAPSGAGWSCTPSSGYPRTTGTITCTRPGALSAGAMPTITVPAAANQSGSIAGSVAVAGYQTSGSAPADRMPDGQSDNNEDDATISVTGGDFVDVSLQKTVTPSTIDSQTGANVTYTLAPRREGGTIQPYGMRVTDTLPAGVSFGAFVSLDPVWNCAATTTTVIDCTHSSTDVSPYTGANFAAMPAIKFTANVPLGGVGTVNNVGTIGLPPALNETNTTNNTDDVSVTRSNTAQLEITKTAPARPVQAGQNFTFNLAIRNNGPMNILPGQTITVNESPGAGLNIVGMTVPGAPANWSCSSATACEYTGGLNNDSVLNVTVTANVPVAAGNFATFSNSAGAGVIGRDSTVVTNGANVVVSNATADVGIVKTVTSPAGPIASGDTVTYNLRVTNNSATTVTGITVTDELNDLVQQNEGGTVGAAPGTPRYPGGGFVSATPTAGGVCPAPTGGVNSASRTLTCTIASLNAGASVDIALQIRPKVASNGTYSNKATAQSSDINDSDDTNDSSTVGIAATAVVDLVALKQVSPTTAAAGEPLNFLATVRNDGPSSAQNVTLVDTLPDNAVLIGNPTVSDSGTCVLGGGAAANPRTAGGTLNCSWVAVVPSRGQRTVTLQMRSLGNLPAATVVRNDIAVATTTLPELRSDNNTAQADATLKRAELDVTLGMSHTADGLLAGEGTRYTITVTNAGPSYATNVVMSDAFPANLSPSVASSATFNYQGGLAIGGAAPSATGAVACTEPAVGATSGPLNCTIPVLPPGASVTISFNMNAHLLPAGASTGTIYHRATVTPSETEWLSNGNDVIVNNVTTDRTSMSLTANNVDLGINKQGPDGPLDAGDTVAYTLTVTNYGRNALSPAGTVTDVLPAGLDFVSASAGCTYATGTRTVSCSVPPLARSADAVFTLTTTLATPYTGARPLVNEASVTVTGDGNSGNDKSRKETKLKPPPGGVAGIPTLSEWGLILLSCLLGLFAMREAAVRRRY